MGKLINIMGTSVIMAMFMASIAFAANAAQPKMVGSQWAIYEENLLPNGNLHFYPALHATTNPAGGVEFAMPDATGSSPVFVNYLLDTYSTSLTEGNTITATMNVAASNPTTSFMGNPLWYNLYGSPTNPAFVRLFVESNLPNDHSATCTGSGNANNYWWAHPDSYAFNPGSGTWTMSVPMNPADWSNICGQSGTANVTVFDNAIANIKYVGLSFGSGYFYSSGAGVDGSTGSATFQLQSYKIS